MDPRLRDTYLSKDKKLFSGRSNVPNQYIGYTPGKKFSKPGNGLIEISCTESCETLPALFCELTRNVPFWLMGCHWMPRSEGSSKEGNPNHLEAKEVRFLQN